MICFVVGFLPGNNSGLFNDVKQIKPSKRFGVLSSNEMNYSATVSLESKVFMGVSFKLMW